jgi:hypothetical protein
LANRLCVETMLRPSRIISLRWLSLLPFFGLGSKAMFSGACLLSASLMRLHRFVYITPFLEEVVLEHVVPAGGDVVHQADGPGWSEVASVFRTQA